MSDTQHEASFSENPTHIKIRGARVHNLKNVSVDIPLHKVTGIAGVSGSGKSSLALGVLYAEGSRRYLESLSTYMYRLPLPCTSGRVFPESAVRLARERSF